MKILKPLGTFIVRSILAACLANSAFAQAPLKIIIADQTGGGPDSLIRPVAEKLTAIMGRPVLVENRPGGQGRIAVQALLNLPADGNTVYLGVQSAVVIYPYIFKFPHDVLTDMMPVTDLARGSLMLLTPTTVPAKDFKEFAEWAKAQGNGKINYGTYSAGSLSHFGGLLLAQSLGVEMTPVHYKGTVDAVKDLVPGVVSFLWNSPAGAIGQLMKAGRLKAHAYMGSTRLATYPDIPTVRELGYPEIEADSWLGIFVAKGTPPDTLRKLQASFAEALGMPDIRMLYANFGLEPGGSSSAEFTKMVHSDYMRWGAYIKKIGYKAEQ
jgi:tripartite-type tricarboxylate transporter receptor subunit TctC